MSNSSLFEPVTIGPYHLPNRIFFAPVSRNRASRDGVQPDYATEYYSQRASAGLIISESAAINDWSGGMNAPGIYSDEQVIVWRKITDAVHAKGGRIFQQFWHSGRVTHQSLLPSSRRVAAPSAIGISREMITYQGKYPATLPQAFTLEEIAELRSDYAQAARNALAAGFDGIEIQAANGYLIDQFLQDAANQRTDQYGGSVENRSRFLMEVLEDAIGIWGANRVGVRLSPTGNFNEIGDTDPTGTFSTLISQLDKLELAYLHIVEQLPWAPLTEEKIALNESLRKLWSGPYIANGGFDATSGAASISAQKATAIAYGRPWIANPDLPQRFQVNASLNEMDEATIYGGDERGYTDYSTLENSAFISQV